MLKCNDREHCNRRVCALDWHFLSELLVWIFKLHRHSVGNSITVQFSSHLRTHELDAIINNIVSHAGSIDTILCKQSQCRPAYFFLCVQCYALRRAEAIASCSLSPNVADSAFFSLDLAFFSSVLAWEISIQPLAFFFSFIVFEFSLF